MTAVDSRPRWLALDGAVNARVVVPGVLVRSDNLQSLSSRDVRLLADREGVEVVLDLRTDVEVHLEGPGPMTREPSVRIEHRSLYPDSGGNTDLELDALRPWERSHGDEDAAETTIVRAYLSYLRRRPDSIVGALTTVARAERAALVHCAAGKDRTGVVVALMLDAGGFEREAIIADYAASGERLEQITTRLLSSATYRPELESSRGRVHVPGPEAVTRFLELVDERFGGSVAWLSGNGLEPADLERLRTRLTRTQSAAAANSGGLR